MESEQNPSSLFPIQKTKNFKDFSSLKQMHENARQIQLTSLLTAHNHV